VGVITDVISETTREIRRSRKGTGHLFVERHNQYPTKMQMAAITKMRRSVSIISARTA
jgi:hypothetical protein